MNYGMMYPEDAMPMAKRKYPIQHSTEYFGAGRIESESCQVLLGIQAEKVLCLYFNMGGEFLKMEARELPQDTSDMVAALMNNLGAVPGTILVEKFSIPEREIEIRDLPDYLQEFVDNPSAFDAERSENLSKYLESWQENGDFVLVWDEDYEMNAKGEVEST